MIFLKKKLPSMKDKYVYTIELWRSSVPAEISNQLQFLEPGCSLNGYGVLNINDIPFAFGKLEGEMFRVIRLIPRLKAWDLLDRNGGCTCIRNRSGATARTARVYGW